MAYYYLLSLKAFDEYRVHNVIAEPSGIVLVGEAVQAKEARVIPGDRVAQIILIFVCLVARLVKWCTALFVERAPEDASSMKPGRKALNHPLQHTVL